MLAWHVHAWCVPGVCLVCAWCVPGVCLVSTSAPRPNAHTATHTPPPHAGAVGAVTAVAVCPSTPRGMRHRQPATVRVARRVLGHAAVAVMAPAAPALCHGSPPLAPPVSLAPVVGAEV